MSFLEADLHLPENHFILYNGEDAGGIIKQFHMQLHSSRKTQFVGLFAGLSSMQVRDFLDVLEGDSQVSKKEMECYDAINRDIELRCNELKLKTILPLSSLITSLFYSTMIVYPFLLDTIYLPPTKGLEVISSAESYIRMLVKPTSSENLYIYKPHSGIAIVFLSYGDAVLPVLISEVDSNNDRQDEVRMKMQGAVLSRQWRCIVPDALKDTPFVLGLYVTKARDVFLYIFHADSNDKVTCLKEGFSLYRKDSALELAKCLFNYRDILLDAINNHAVPNSQSFSRLRDTFISGDYYDVSDEEAER